MVTLGGGIFPLAFFLTINKNARSIDEDKWSKDDGNTFLGITQIFGLTR